MRISDGSSDVCPSDLVRVTADGEDLSYVEALSAPLSITSAPPEDPVDAEIVTFGPGPTAPAVTEDAVTATDEGDNGEQWWIPLGVGAAILAAITALAVRRPRP